MRSPFSRGSSDAGFTLIELAVAGSLTIIVLGVVGGIMISSQHTEGVVRTVSQATTDGQTVTNSIETGIRNSENSLSTSVPFKITVPAVGDLLLTALVVGDGTTASAKCKAWYYSGANKSIRFKTSTTAIGTPTLAALGGWTLLSANVSPIGGTPVFASTGTNGLALSFQESAGSDPAVPFQSSVYSATTLTGSVACY